MKKTRSLIYHIYLDGNPEIIYENLTTILTFDHYFDYKYYKVVSNKYEENKHILRGFNRSYKVYENIPSLGEVVGFKDCLDLSLKENPLGITLVAGTNGASRTGAQLNENIRRWARAMYLLSLSNCENKIDPLFDKGAAAVGAFLKTFPMNKAGPRTCPWHYSGTLYWICNKYLNSQPSIEIANCRHGIEMFPGYNIPLELAYNLYDTSHDLYHHALSAGDWMSQL